MKFVIHEHHAKRAGLHWDIRIQFKACKHKNDLCLYSFATRKLPDFVDGKLKKILLFQTPDHEKWWLTFEGELKEGYGAGRVYIWDKGNIIWREKRNNLFIITFKGHKLKGSYVFLKLENDRDEWLFFKSKKFT